MVLACTRTDGMCSARCSTSRQRARAGTSSTLSLELARHGIAAANASSQPSGGGGGGAVDVAPRRGGVSDGARGAVTQRPTGAIDRCMCAAARRGRGGLSVASSEGAHSTVAALPSAFRGSGRRTHVRTEGCSCARARGSFVGGWRGTELRSRRLSSERIGDGRRHRARSTLGPRNPELR